MPKYYRKKVGHQCLFLLQLSLNNIRLHIDVLFSFPFSEVGLNHKTVDLGLPVADFVFISFDFPICSSTALQNFAIPGEIFVYIIIKMIAEKQKLIYEFY